MAPASGAGSIDRVRRTLLGAGVAALLILPVAADRVTAAVLEHRLAARLRCLAALSAAPDVHLGGFPVLTQLAAHRLDAVRVQAANVRLGRTTVARLDAEATGVGVGGGGASASSVSVDATVPYAQLAGMMPAGDFHVVGGDDARRLVVQGTVPIRGINLPATVYADLALAGGKLTVTPDEVELSGLGLRIPASRLPGAAGRARSVDLPALPGGLAYRSVAATHDGLEVVAGGAALHLGKTGKAKTCGGTGE